MNAGIIIVPVPVDTHETGPAPWYMWALLGVTTVGVLWIFGLMLYDVFIGMKKFRKRRKK
jgi:hypothetical protein